MADIIDFLCCIWVLTFFAMLGPVMAIVAYIVGFKDGWKEKGKNG